MTNMTDLQAFDDAVEAETRRAKVTWVALGALTGALGVGYAGYSLLAPGEAAAVSATEQYAISPPSKSADPLPGAVDSLTVSESEEKAREAATQGASGDTIEEGSETVAIESDREATTPTEVEQSPPVQYATNGAFYVQVASYKTQAPADARASALSASGLPAQVSAYGGPDAGWWHAVRLGPFKTRADAEASRFKLHASDRRQSYVLPRSNGKYHVQVASFAKEEQAKDVAKSFAAQGHATKISRIRMAGQRWFCVRIGPFDTREEALEYQPLVKDIPGGKSEVIPFPPPPADVVRE